MDACWWFVAISWRFPIICAQLLTCTEEATQVAAKCLQKTNIYIYIYIYIYMYICMYIQNIYKYTHVYIYIYIYIYIYVSYKYIYINIWYIYVNIYRDIYLMDIYTSMSISIYIYLSIYLYVYIYTIWALIVFYSLTRATLMSPGQDEIRVCPVGVTSLYRVLNYRAINKWVDFQIKKNNFFGT